MGNTVSDSEEGKLNCPADGGDDLSDGDDDNEDEIKATTDLCQLFEDSATLRAAATKVKEKVSENVFMTLFTRIRQFIDDHTARTQDGVTLAQFCDLVMPHGVERADAIKEFRQFDCDGSGIADTQIMLDAIRQYSSRGALGELGKSTRILQSCSLTPGFVDVYAGKTFPVEKHGARILKYLMRNRAETSSMPFPFLNSFNNIYSMRSSVLQSTLTSISSDTSEGDVESEYNEYERRTIYNCYSNIEVSSNASESHLLRHNSLFWQSDGSARSHWIRMKMKANVVVKSLSIGVASADESYMPEIVTISVGNSPGKLREIKEIKVDNHFTGQVTLLTNMKVHYPYVQVGIKRCHGDGCDTRVHGIKIVGYKYFKDQGVAVVDACALWYLQMLTSTVNISLVQNPILKNMLLTHTKKALESMPPLSLSGASSERPSFLNKHVLQEVDTFISQLAQSQDTGEVSVFDALQVSLALNLATGSVRGLVKLLKYLIDLQSVSLPCAELLAKALSARNACWEKIGTALPVTCEGSDGGTGAWNAGPEVVIDSQTTNSSNRSSSSATSSNRVYLTDDGKTNFSMVFKSDEHVQITKIRIQVASGAKSPRYGLVFVYNPESIPELSSKFSLQEHIDYFSKYDIWREKEFSFSIGYRNAGLGGLPDNPVAYFKFDNDCDELEVPTSWNAVGQNILVKFMEPRVDTSTRLGIVSVQFFGIPRPKTLVSHQKSVVVPDPSKNETCEQPEIVSIVLTFVADLAMDQVKRRGKISKQYDFLDLSDLDVSSLWELHEKCLERVNQGDESNKSLNQWKRSSLLVLQLIHSLIPVLATAPGTSEASRNKLFDQLCQIVDNSSSSPSKATEPSTNIQLKIIKQIIIDGAPLFFPEKSKKRDELFKLLKSISDQPSKPSMSLVFQSLCQFFSSVDPQGLLDLPKNPKEDFSPSSTLAMMESLIIVACHEMDSFALTATSKASGKTSIESKGQKCVTFEKEHKVEASLDNSDTKSAPTSTEEQKTLSSVDELDSETSNSGDPSATTLSSPASKSDSDTNRESEKSSESIQASICSEMPTSRANSNVPIDSNQSSATSKSANNEEEEAPSAASAESSEDADVDDRHHLTFLVKLTASLQTALMSWCWQQLSKTKQEESEKLKATVNNVILSYAIDVSKKASQYLDILLTMEKEELNAKINLEHPHFLSVILRQLTLLLNSLVDLLNTETKVAILQNFKKVAIGLNSLAVSSPLLFSDLSTNCWTEADSEETVLRVWEVESPHDYLNHSNITQVFRCPGASRFILDFDPRCETERRYDFLEFTDAKGVTKRFDQKVGCTKWPRQVTFCGPYVSFLFHSDSSNTEWGYKFTVTAKGSPDMHLSWLADLQLSLVKLLGQLCGSTLSANPILREETTTTQEDASEQDILRSDLWTSLFRGGYMVGKLQRSLSGRFQTGDGGQVYNLLTDVEDLVSGQQKEQQMGEEEDQDKKQARVFYDKCKSCAKNVSKLKVGGPKVDAAVTSAFVALVWHCQQLREDVDKFLNSTQGEISDGLGQAFTMAESLRMSLANERQKWKALDDKDENADPADVFAAKCMFLLKFAGLTKVQLRNELRSKYYKHKKAGNKMPVVRNEVLEKFPSFRLVMEFVQDPAWTAERVHHLLQDRIKFASAICDVYLFAAEMLEVLSRETIFQVTVGLFFRELFTYQDKFSCHYADGLDGCGLELESKVRRGYYKLVHQLVDAFRKLEDTEKDVNMIPAYDFMQGCLLHLLDVDWQPNDLTFVLEMQLPQLYLSIAKETVKMRDLTVTNLKEEEEMAEYDQAMKWFGEVEMDQDINEWFKNKENNVKMDRKALKMFVARFSDTLDAEILCDGCGVTLPGRRYRCLQCLDMDLCTSCFSGGVEPEDHRDDHEIVHLVYKCNDCQAFIVGTRIHCNQCDDFDLCLGCHNKHKYPSGHTEEHSITKIPLVTLKTSQSSNPTLKAYIHQHAWLLYSSLTLTLSDIVYGTDMGMPYIDQDYIKLAGQLQKQCVEQATLCLDQVAGEIDGEKEKEMPPGKRREETFARHSQERIMGLLGSVMPSDEKRSTNTGFCFFTDEFLHLLLKVSRGENELNTQLLALQLIGRLLANIDAKNIEITGPKTSTETKGGILTGHQTISQLFAFGAKSFEKNGLQWACSVARMLQSLLLTPEWKLIINQHISQCVHSLKHNIDISCIFPMFVIAGFPEVLTTGTMVDYNYTSVDTQPGVVLKHFPDKHQALIVDLKTRKRHTVKDQQVSYHMEESEVWENINVTKFVTFTIETIDRIKAGEDMSAETMWVLSLALKVLNRCFKSNHPSSVSAEVFTAGFIQALVYMVCNGTGMNQNWLLKDLEVLSLIWYTQDGSTMKKMKLGNLKDKKKDKKSSKRKTSDEKESEEMAALSRMNRDALMYYCSGDDDNDDDDNDDDSSDSSDSDDDDDDDENNDDDDDGNSDYDDIWSSSSWSCEDKSSPKKKSGELPGELSKESNFEELLESLRLTFDIPQIMLKQLSNLHDKDPERVIKSIIENFGEPVSNFLAKWKSKGILDSGKKESDQAAIDHGITEHPVTGTANKAPETAERETGENPQNLFKQQEKLAGEINEKMRGKSSNLLKKELEMHGKSGPKEDLLKVNRAMCVLYARHTLTGLLSFWPDDGPPITSNLLGCKDVKQIPCVLDLLYKADTQDCFGKVVERVIHLSDGASLLPIAFTAAQFMEEVTLSAVTCESHHSYTDKDKKKDTVTLSGASYLTITFDPRCAVSENDSLIFSTRQQMDKDMHTFSGSTKAKWSSFHLPGDTLHYKFDIEEWEKNDLWGYSFTVTPGTKDSFETGYTILKAVLSSLAARSLPLENLWLSLVYVACKQPGIERLKAISLMLRVIALQRKGQQAESNASLKIELSILKPLWELYRSITKEEDNGNTIQPAVARALTDLFLHTENLACEWDITETYLAALLDIKDIKISIMQGLANVAAIGHMINHDNKATDFMKDMCHQTAERTFSSVITGLFMKSEKTE